ncbi:MAG: hypothetical protein HON53_09515 [Planctomycetaceae bacterium]|jgi:hypothetical protein|nr:hypothetical protein [Planctomycetaceae bacterium]MBT6153446.1 hypothetical protein [Planctomycetaceae bacterium]MBT6484722.1 hypothetical protein [Planctomycetaceae bacterium]MBT6496472.1 hypothetical protein [Planctomycetaceae bacterium]
MLINGQPDHNSFTKPVALPRPDGSSLHLLLSPLPLGFHSRLRKNGIVQPHPPTRVARDSSCQPIRDKQGLAVLRTDEHDTGFVDELELYHQRVAVLVLAESLRADTNIKFETSPPESSDDWREYADHLYRELQQAGWTAGDLILLCDEISRLSNMLTDHIEETQENFSSGASRAALPTT